MILKIIRPNKINYIKINIKKWSKLIKFIYVTFHHIALFILSYCKMVCGRFLHRYSNYLVCFTGKKRISRRIRIEIEAIERCNLTRHYRWQQRVMLMSRRATISQSQIRASKKVLSSSRNPIPRLSELHWNRNFFLIKWK